MNISDLKTGSSVSGVDIHSENIVNINLKKGVSAEKREELMRARKENAPEDANFEKDAQLVGKDLGNGRTEFVPASAGIYDAKREEEKDDVEKILEKFDKEYLPNKIKEIEEFNAALDMAGSLTEEEVLQMQGKEFVTKAIEDPRRLGALKTHELTEEEVKEKYEKEQEILRRKDEMKAMQNQNNTTIDYNPNNYKNLPGMEDDYETTPVGSVEDLANPTFEDNGEYEMENTNQNITNTIVEELETPKEELFTEESTILKSDIDDETPSNKIESDVDTTETEDDEDFVLPQSEFIESEVDTEEDEEKDPDDGKDVIIENLDDHRETDEEISERFQKSIRDKIKPVTKAFDISTYTVATKAIPFSNSVQQKTNHFRRAKWALMSTGRPITMRSFKSTELDELYNYKTDSKYMTIKKQYSIIFNHIEDPKPQTVEDWAKVNSFLDLDHIWFAIYRSCYEGANYIPRDCSDSDNCRNMFLTDDVPIMDMVKFKDKEAKKRFFNILNKDADVSSTMYVSEITPVSDDYAIAFREPSIYNIVFESALLEDDFLNKHQSLVSVLAYVDKVYKIDHESHSLIPINVPIFNDNVTKTYKARIKAMSKVLDTLTSDQYRFILAIIDSINKRGDEVSYIYPEVTCPKCKKVVREVVQNSQNMVFLRHQLVALAL